MRKLRAGTMREQCTLLLQQTGLDDATWRVGRTLVFMASEEVLAELDELRVAKIAQ